MSSETVTTIPPIDGDMVRGLAEAIAQKRDYLRQGVCPHANNPDICKIPQDIKENPPKGGTSTCYVFECMSHVKTLVRAYKKIEGLAVSMEKQGWKRIKADSDPEGGVGITVQKDQRELFLYVFQGGSNGEYVIGVLDLQKNLIGLIYK